jgi:hypothetical protein
MFRLTSIHEHLKTEKTGRDCFSYSVLEKKVKADLYLRKRYDLHSLTQSNVGSSISKE